MTTREKTLAAAVAAAGALWFGATGLQKYRDAIDRRVEQQRLAEQALSDAKFAQARGLRARARLNAWRDRSLPTDRAVAKSLYQDWLRGQLTAAGMNVAQLVDRSAVARNPHFEELAFDVTASGTLAQLADFLYRFYTAVHLHRISTATISAEEGGQKLSIALTASALVLSDASRADQLAEGQPLKLSRSAEEFATSLVSRNLFVPAGAKSGSDASGGDDAAAAAVVTAMTSDGRGPRIGVKSGDEITYFREGDPIKFGKFEGTVVKLDSRRAVVKTAGGEMELRLGQKLSEATALESAPASAESTANGDPPA
jgi:hypothetical protein